MRMTTYVQAPDYRAVESGSDWAAAAAAVRPRCQRRVERRAHCLIVAQRLEVGIVARERAVFGVQRDGAFEVRDRFGVLAALRVRDGQHVNRVVVVRIFVADEAQVRDRLIVGAAVDGQRRGVEALVDRLRRVLALRGLTLADVQVQPHPLVQFLFFRMQAQHRLEQASASAQDSLVIR